MGTMTDIEEQIETELEQADPIEIAVLAYVRHYGQNPEDLAELKRFEDLATEQAPRTRKPLGMARSATGDHATEAPALSEAGRPRFRRCLS